MKLVTMSVTISTWNSVGLSNLPVVVEPLLGHLGDHEGGPGDVLLGHHQPGLRDQHVQPVTQDLLLPPQLRTSQEVDWKNFPAEGTRLFSFSFLKKQLPVLGHEWEEGRLAVMILRQLR